MLAELSYNALITDPNLVAYYKLEDVNDSKGTNTLTNYGGVVFNPGLFNKGSDLGSSNTSKFVWYPSNFGITSTTSCSISFWVKLNAEINTTEIWTLVMLGNATGAYFQVYYRYNSSAGFRVLQLDNGGTGPAAQISGLTMGTTSWYHVVIVRNNSNATTQVYLNGQLFQSSTVTGTSSVNSSFFSIGGQAGASSANYGNYSSTIIDDVAVFNRVLTSTEVNSIYLTSTPSASIKGLSTIKNINSIKI